MRRTARPPGPRSTARRELIEVERPVESPTTTAPPAVGRPLHEPNGGERLPTPGPAQTSHPRAPAPSRLASSAAAACAVVDTRRCASAGDAGRAEHADHVARPVARVVRHEREPQTPLPGAARHAVGSGRSDRRRRQRTPSRSQRRPGRPRARRWPFVRGIPGSLTSPRSAAPVVGSSGRIATASSR